jgi:hypothetical protein
MRHTAQHTRTIRLETCTHTHLLTYLATHIHIQHFRHKKRSWEKRGEAYSICSLAVMSTPQAAQ